MEKKTLTVKKIKNERTKFIETGITKNYQMFYSHETQRKKKENSIKNIIESIQEHGVVSAINVRPSDTYEGRYEVYDGQHTLSACKALGVNVVYNVFEDVSNKAMITINGKSRKNWQLEDFLHYGVADRMYDYVFLSEMYDKSNIKLTALINMYGGRYSNQSFKKLEWKALTKQRGDDILSYINDLANLYNVEHSRHTRFVWGLCDIYDSGLYDHKRMLTQMDKCSKLLKKQANPKDYARNIQEVYNYGLGAKNKVQFIQD